jgi:hypothetical protein
LVAKGNFKHRIAVRQLDAFRFIGHSEVTALRTADNDPSAHQFVDGFLDDLPALFVHASVCVSIPTSEISSEFDDDLPLNGFGADPAKDLRRIHLVWSLILHR